MSTTRTAIVSVFNKSGVVDLCDRLSGAGWNILSTGGTEKALREAGVNVKAVSDVTKFPEILGGRVKTLHPAIHGGILARDTLEHSQELQTHGIDPITLVVCNLYPFVETTRKEGVQEQDIVEEIDIGGVTLLRAGAKNFESCAVLCDPDDYALVGDALTSGNTDLSLEQRKKLALKAFRHTATYDASIAQYFASKLENADQLTQMINLQADQIQQLRYGENPHQQGALYKWTDRDYPFEQLQGKELSYNNILDIDAAWDVVLEFNDAACSIVKHLTPCGIATGANIVEAYKKAFESDTVSAFGSIIAVNRQVTAELCEAIGSLFLEVLVAKEYTPEALEWLSKKKKNCRVMKVIKDTPVPTVIRSVHGGLLVQTPNIAAVNSSNWKIVSTKTPDAQMIKDLEFAWGAVKHVKSNAIVFTQGTATVGIGCGQPNRLDSVRSAAHHAGEKAKGAMCSSDAFFPFPDGVEAAASHGVAAIIQPGGSIRDDEVIEVANKLGIVMVFTGERHFKH